MKKFLAIVLALYSTVPVVAQPVYDDNFTNAILRIDYFHEGDAESETFKPDRLYRYGEWAGSRVNLIDELNYGEYYYKVYDASTGSLIYSRGFDSYFKEYQTSEPANKGVSRRFHETALIPFPKRPVHFAVEKRRLEGDLQEIYRLYIDPSEGVLDWQKDPGVKVYISQISGPVSEKADIVIVGEGYTAGEEDKFSADLLRFTDIFFWEEPCRSARMSFNIYGLFKPSEDSGIDEPRAGIDKNTAVGASFNAMGAERYVLVEDHRALRDIAGHVPYDAIYVMINHERYGGGGIYNLYCTFTSDNPWSPFLMIHEFGHSFFGLADEYYTSSTAYTDFYPPGYEPAEPNITALLDTSRLKWSHLVAPQTPVPTPWTKEMYDETDYAWQQQREQLNEEIARLRREGAPESEIDAARSKYEALDLEHTEAMQELLDKNQFAGRVGAFEGAGYMSSGLYRPMVSCIMFSKGTSGFCLVCQEAMKKVIEWYAE